jgi:hypothetical protein
MRSVKKILLATINYDHPQRGMQHAFEGVFGRDNVFEFDYLAKQREGIRADHISAQFVEKVDRVQPDWVWMQVQDTGVLSAEAIEDARRRCTHAIFTHWTGDCRPSVSPYLSSICRATDLTFTSAAGQVELFRAAGAHLASYLQIGVDWEQDLFPTDDWEPPFRVPEIVFCGSYYGSTFPKGTLEREAAIRALQGAGLDVGIVGNGWPGNFPVVGTCGVKEQVHIWRRAKVALNVNHFNDIERYYSDRQLIAMGSGTPTVCHYVPGLEKEFGPEHCYVYRDEAELVAACRRLLGSPDLARYLGRAGRQEVIRNHTWFSRILEALPLIENLRS